ALGAAQERRDDLREDVPADARERPVAGQPLRDREGRRARAAADLDDGRRTRGGQLAEDGLRTETVVDLVQEVVVREVVEPQRQPRGREEDLLAGLLAGEDLGA